MKLSNELFQTVITHTPLISIDLVVRNSSGEVLLGLRSNKPAKGFWFVPGGRIYKDEPLDKAFARLTKLELGQSIPRGEATFLGVYEHFYQDNYFGEEFTTHYVVLAYELAIQTCDCLPHEQHEKYSWFNRECLLADRMVHANTKAYFEDHQ